MARTSYGSGKTTVRELKSTLDDFLTSLRKTSKNLAEEIAAIDQNAAAIRQEFEAGALAFARNTVPALSGPAFDQTAALAQGVTELTDQGLAYYRDSLLRGREDALASVNRVLPETVDMSGFPNALGAAMTRAERAKNRATEAGRNARAAADAHRTWQESDEQTLVNFDNELRSKGKPGIEPGTKDYYDTDSLTQAVIRYLTRDASYREVRKTLVRYRQGFDGRDAFADIALFKKRGEAAAAAHETAIQEQTAADRDQANAQSLYQTLSRAGKNIRPDAEILEAVQAKLAGYLSTPAFLKAAADEYGEDFPASLPPLAAKLKALGVLRTNVQENLDKLNRDIRKATDSYDKIRRADSARRISVDLDQVRAENKRYSDGYRDYAGGIARRRETTWDDSFSGRSGMSVWDYLVLDSIINDHRQAADPVSFSGSERLPSAPGSMDLDDIAPGTLDLGSREFDDIFNPRSDNGGFNLNELFEDIASGKSDLDLSPKADTPAPIRSSSSDSDFPGWSSGPDSSGSMDL